jgi:hypothetical protein
MGFSLTSKGSFKNTETFLNKMLRGDIYGNLSKYGQQGVAALSAATPVESSLTANSWYYEIEKKGKTVTIIWRNSNVVNGVPIAIILQYGHATGTGGYVQGRDYINPAIKPVMDQIALDVWKVVTSG